MEDSILKTIKKLLGLNEDDTFFDTEVIININTVLSMMTQMAEVPTFSITGYDENWSDYIGDEQNLEMVKTYVYLKVRLIFDPPSNSVLMTAIEKTISELEWRINAETDIYRGGD